MTLEKFENFTPDENAGAALWVDKPGEYLMRIIGVRQEKTKRDDMLCLLVEMEVVKDYSGNGQEGRQYWERFYLTGSEGSYNRIALLFAKARVTEKGALVVKVNDTGIIADDYVINQQYASKLVGAVIIVNIGAEMYHGEQRLKIGFNINRCSDEDWEKYASETPSASSLPSDVPDQPDDIPF